MITPIRISSAFSLLLITLFAHSGEEWKTIQQGKKNKIAAINRKKTGVIPGRYNPVKHQKTFYKIGYHDGCSSGKEAELQELKKSYKGKNEDGRTYAHLLYLYQGIETIDLDYFTDETKNLIQDLSLDELDRKDFNGQTPTCIAAWRGKLESVQLLIDAGCNPNSIDFKGRSILHNVIRNLKTAPIHEHASRSSFLTNNKRFNRLLYTTAFKVVQALNNKKTLDVSIHDDKEKTALEWLKKMPPVENRDIPMYGEMSPHQRKEAKEKEDLNQKDLIDYLQKL